MIIMTDQHFLLNYCQIRECREGHNKKKMKKVNERNMEEEEEEEDEEVRLKNDRWRLHNREEKMESK